MEDNNGSLRNEKQRHRSPNFPYASLSECVNNLKKLYSAIQLAKIPSDVALNHMGLTLNSSTSDRIRASMASYGLITEELVNKEKYVRISDLGRRIAIDTRDISPDRKRAFREAVFNDPMMKKIWAEWKRQLPKEISTILQLNYKFQERAAERFATVIRQNYQFCDLYNYYESIDEDDLHVEEQETTPPPSGKFLGSTEKIGEGQDIIPSSMRKANLLLGKNREVIIYVPNDLTEEEFNLIPTWLGIQKYGLLADENDKK